MKYLSFMFLLLLSLMGASWAADTAPIKSDPVWLTEVRSSIKAEKYYQAIQQLQAANEKTRQIGIIC
jgi:cytochrome b subunit of formate dehydrogenase